MSEATMTINEWLRANVEPATRTLYRTDIARWIGSAPAINPSQVAAHVQFPEHKIAEAYRNIILSGIVGEGECAFLNGESMDTNPYRDADTEAAAHWAEGWIEMRKESDSYDFSWRAIQ